MTRRRLTLAQVLLVRRIRAAGGKVRFLSGLDAHAYLSDREQSVRWQTLMSLEKIGIVTPTYETDGRGFRTYSGWDLDMSKVEPRDGV